MLRWEEEGEADRNSGARLRGSRLVKPLRGCIGPLCGFLARRFVRAQAGHGSVRDGGAVGGEDAEEDGGDGGYEGHWCDGFEGLDEVGEKCVVVRFDAMAVRAGIVRHAHYCKYGTVHPHYELA
jgi:hypothetical protein